MMDMREICCSDESDKGLNERDSSKLQKCVLKCVPRKVIWWALRKLGVEEWIVRLVQGM